MSDPSSDSSTLPTNIQLSNWIAIGVVSLFFCQLCVLCTIAPGACRHRWAFLFDDDESSDEFTTNKTPAEIEKNLIIRKWEEETDSITEANESESVVMCHGSDDHTHDEDAVVVVVASSSKNNSIVVVDKKSNVEPESKTLSSDDEGQEIVVDLEFGNHYSNHSNDKHNEDNNDDDGVSSIFSESKGCIICLMPYRTGDMVCNSRNPACGHTFHKKCMMQWLKRHNVCPTCRQPYILKVV